MALINGAVGGGLVVPPTAASGSFLPLTGGTLSGQLNMGANKIVNVANGTVATDAAAYGQVSSLVTGVSSVFTRTGAVVATSGDYTVGQVTGAAPLASPTFTGTVTLPDGTTAASTGITAGAAIAMGSHKITGLTNGSAASDAAAFGQITAANAGALALTGGTMSGAIAMGANKITGLANGTVSTDAAAFGQIPTFAGYGFGGTATAPVVALTNASGHITSNVPLSTNTLTDVFSTASLAVGTWLVTMSATIFNQLVSSNEIKAVVGTATATFEGVTSDGFSITTAVTAEGALTVAFIATVTVAGTLKLQAECSNSSSASVQATTAGFGFTNCTGYTATRIA